ncbi:MAG TPA: VOC family protein [Anaerolineales bacterium]|nr:VOC family protein [Anaerolineales bacterium]
MRIDHVALWTRDLTILKGFYETYFEARASDLYRNSRTQFQSYFLTFADGARLELMQAPDVGPAVTGRNLGYAHLALSVGSKEDVDHLTDRLQAAGYQVDSGPRTTGDGYYESVVQDPDGNLIEITI